MPGEPAGLTGRRCADVPPDGRGKVGRSPAIPRSPCNPVPADQPMQHRLGLVVGRVAGRDPRGSGFGRDFREELVAHAAGGRFQVLAGRECRDIDDLHSARDGESCTQIAHECLVCVRFRAAKLVVDVRDSQRSSPSACSARRSATRVRAAGNRDHARAGSRLAMKRRTSRTTRTALPKRRHTPCAAREARHTECAHTFPSRRMLLNIVADC